MPPFPGPPSSIRAPHGADVFEVHWPGGAQDRIPHAVLRGYCPCAGCQGHSGSIKLQLGRNTELRDLRPVGNYALGLTWGDGHATGIYSYEYLHRLGRLLDAHGADGLLSLGELPPAP